MFLMVPTALVPLPRWTAAVHRLGTAPHEHQLGAVLQATSTHRGHQHGPELQAVAQLMAVVEEEEAPLPTAVPATSAEVAHQHGPATHAPLTATMASGPQILLQAAPPSTPSPQAHVHPRTPRPPLGPQPGPAPQLQHPLPLHAPTTHQLQPRQPPPPAATTTTHTPPLSLHPHQAPAAATAALTTTTAPTTTAPAATTTATPLTHQPPASQKQLTPNRSRIIASRSYSMLPRPLRTHRRLTLLVGRWTHRRRRREDRGMQRTTTMIEVETELQIEAETVA